MHYGSELDFHNFHTGGTGHIPQEEGHRTPRTTVIVLQYRSQNRPRTILLANTLELPKEVGKIAFHTGSIVSAPYSALVRCAFTLLPI